MLRPFHLKGPIGLEYNMDLDDAFNTKKALRDLGHFRVPKFGLTPYPDEPMIDGIKSFQRQNGLREDGVMKPDGPTIKRFNDTLVERQRSKRSPRPFSTVPLPRSLPRPDIGIQNTVKRDNIPPNIWRGPAPYNPNIVPTLLQQSAKRKNRRSPFFGTGGDLGLGRTNRPVDILALKRALVWAGHFPRNKALGAENRLDESLITAVRRFQQDAGVKVDGLLRPGGETEKALDATIAPRVQAFKSESAGKASADSKGDTDGPQIAMAPKPRRDGGSDILEGPGITSPFIGGGAAAIGTGIAAQQIIRQHLQEKGLQMDEVPSPPEPGTVRPRTDMAPAVPPTPGLEPPDDRDRPPTKTESPAEPVETLTLEGRPINELMRNDPLIFQKISEDLRKEFSRPLQSHRGDPVTQRWNTRVAGEIFDRAISRWGPEKSKEIGHTGGATHARGERLPEDHLRNRDVPIGEDGRRGSSNPDITHTHLPSKKNIYTNTGRTLKDGRTGVADERRSYERLKKNAVGHLNAFLPKYRPGMDEEAMAKVAEEIYVEVLTELWGPPPERK